MRAPTFSPIFYLMAAVLLVLPGCSVHQLAVDRFGDALAQTGTNFTADDDPDLVGQALPFGLKLMEGI
ncbi:MAG: TRAP transporter TatT component family protein, partial [Acidobacteria bacterium]|nr:TRAP transporter TatT component family protein [Acidobacteriota bacterium]